jgi:hypothetical protein
VVIVKFSGSGGGVNVFIFKCSGSCGGVYVIIVKYSGSGKNNDQIDGSCGGIINGS